MNSSVTDSENMLLTHDITNISLEALNDNERNSTQHVDSGLNRWVTENEDMHLNELASDISEIHINEPESHDDRNTYEFPVATINSMKMFHHDKDEVYQLAKSLIQKTINFTSELIVNDNGMNVTQSLSTAAKHINNQLPQSSTKHKRDGNFENNPLFVRPQSRALGIRSTKAPGNQTPTKYPKITRNTFQYIPISESVKTDFIRKDFEKNCMILISDQIRKKNSLVNIKGLVAATFFINRTYSESIQKDCKYT